MIVATKENLGNYQLCYYVQLETDHDEQPDD